jgi:hypothetical protein
MSRSKGQKTFGLRAKLTAAAESPVDNIRPDRYYPLKIICPPRLIAGNLFTSRLKEAPIDSAVCKKGDSSSFG